MSPSSLVKLIQSLSGSEKRYFKLQTKTQAGYKEYLQLFDLIDQEKYADTAALKQAFMQRSSTTSWDNSCNYLGKLLMDCLIRAKKDKDTYFDLLNRIMEINILRERCLHAEARKQIRKLQTDAAQLQFHSIEYISHRLELDELSDNNFDELSDDDLIKAQMKAKDILRNLNHIHDHYSLFEILKYRLIHSGKISSEEDKKRMNDLILSEMVLVADKTKKTFTSQKLHLLFQSFFFTDIGDYHSALQSFHQLNELFEKNEKYWDHPPVDYLSALNGIIDSLIVLGKESEIALYIDKLHKLEQNTYPEYFRFQVKKTIAVHQLASFIRTDSLAPAWAFIDSIDKEVITAYQAINEEKQSELFFYCSLLAFKTNDLKKAHLYIRDIMSQFNLAPQLFISRAIRLLNIIIYFQRNDLLHLDYEIRSYKRHFQSVKLLRTEKLLIRIVHTASSNKKLKLLTAERKAIQEAAIQLKNDKYEKQLLKYFDFDKWIINLIVRTTDFSSVIKRP